MLQSNVPGGRFFAHQTYHFQTVHALNDVTADGAGGYERPISNGTLMPSQRWCAPAVPSAPISQNPFPLT